MYLNYMNMPLFPMPPRASHADDRYTTHCVKCGKLVIERERDWDGHRSEAGKEIFRDRGIEMHWGGRWCERCDFELAQTVGYWLQNP